MHPMNLTENTTTPATSPERLDRARATLEHTHGSTGNDWLHALTARNLRRVDARRVLAAEVAEREQLRGYHPRLRDRARAIW